MPATRGGPLGPDAVLTEASRLAELLDAGSAVTLLDVRWALGDPHGHEQYLAGHLPGAVFVDLDRELSGPPTAADGRHPLPPLARLEQAARRWGVRREVPVVAYDGSGNLAAARAWWLLRWGGHPRVSLLDGGLAGWLAAGLPLTGGPHAPVPGDVVLHGGGMPVIDAAGITAAARTGRVLDARAGERYRGELEPLDPRAGHIPGAWSAPTADNLGPDGRFLPAAVLRERFAAMGVGTPGGPAHPDGPAGPSPTVAVYCGSGVTAAHQIAALTLAGVDGAALYPGSWSQWSADPSRPLATGPEPG